MMVPGDAGSRPSFPADAVVLIPARRASTRLADKLLLAETGLPVLIHTCRQAALACGRDRVVVCADDPELIRIAQADGFDARLTRADHNSGTDRIAEVAAGLEAAIVVNVQADEPEIDPEHIITVAGLLATRPEAGMATLVTPGDSADQHDPARVKVLCAADGRALAFTRSPVPWDRDAGAPAAACLRHLGIYAYRRPVLLGYHALPTSALEACEKLEQLRAIEAGVTIVCAPVAAGPPGIDTPADYQAFCARFAASSRASHKDPA